MSFWKRKFNSLNELVKHKSNLYKIKYKRLKISYKVKNQIRKGVFAIEIKNHLGIGARLIWCLEILLYCKENNLKPFFKFTYEDSNENEDYFSAFFQIPDTEPPAKLKFITISTIGDLSFPKNYNKELDIVTANQLLQKYIVPLKDIAVEVNSFFDKELKGGNTLGVHYRNTDKKSEAPPVTYEYALKNIDECFIRKPLLERVFITSDDKEFIEFMKNSHISSKVVFRNDSFRSNDGTAIHERFDLNKYDINKDAIVNMLILTKCSFIIKTASILSSCSLLFNPEIPFIMLNKPYDNKLWFPESELIKKTEFQSISEHN